VCGPGGGHCFGGSCGGAGRVVATPSPELWCAGRAEATASGGVVAVRAGSWPLLPGSCGGAGLVTADAGISGGSRCGSTSAACGSPATAGPPHGDGGRSAFAAPKAVVDPPPSTEDGGRSARSSPAQWPPSMPRAQTVVDVPTSRRRVGSADRPPSSTRHRRWPLRAARSGAGVPLAGHAFRRLRWLAVGHARLVDWRHPGRRWRRWASHGSPRSRPGPTGEPRRPLATKIAPAGHYYPGVVASGSRGGHYFPGVVAVRGLGTRMSGFLAGATVVRSTDPSQEKVEGAGLLTDPLNACLKAA
jgi:hypothetical protein